MICSYKTVQYTAILSDKLTIFMYQLLKIVVTTNYQIYKNEIVEFHVL